MGAKTRQFGALTRKNYINWKRQPGCSFLEICCPAAIMFLMVWIRSVIDPVTSTDQVPLNMYQSAQFIPFKYVNGEWEEKYIYHPLTFSHNKEGKELSDFMEYD